MLPVSAASTKYWSWTSVNRGPDDTADLRASKKSMQRSEKFRLRLWPASHKLGR
jgi:hypothetical protein